ncbi:hypothetical protein ACXZ9C_11695 [Streptococcus agalactiae]
MCVGISSSSSWRWSGVRRHALVARRRQSVVSRHRQLVSHHRRDSVSVVVVSWRSSSA